MTYPPAHSSFAPYLREGETILWTGQPAGRLFVFQRLDVFLVPFSLVWAGFVFSVIPQAMLSNGAFFVAFGTIFLLAGAYATIGRFLISAYMRRRTLYALTDRRALILKNLRATDLGEQPLHADLPVSFRGQREGQVTFGNSGNGLSHMGGFGFWQGEDGSFTFRAIPDPEAVYRLAQQAKEARP